MDPYLKCCVIAGFIERNCWASMLEFFNSLIKALAVECEENRIANEVGKQKTKPLHRIPITGTTFKKCTPDNTAFNHQSNKTNLLPNRSVIGKTLHLVVDIFC